MRLDQGAHLTYCSNIHPGESWVEVEDALREHVPRIRGHLGHRGAFGLGLRLSARAARALRAPEALAAFRAWMDERDAYVFTLNGFPYGPFHGTPVKEAVYRPDWSTTERVEYTQDLIDVLASLLPEGQDGSISTVPGAFRHDPAAADPDAIVSALVEVAHRCWHVRQDSGVDICVGLEPEPMCMLETTREAVRFFEEHLFRDATVLAFADRTGCPRGDAEAALRHHLGICFDTCHAAVEFEDPAEGPALLRAAGVRVAKVQVTAGLELPRVTEAGMLRLERFAEDVYLHQVVVEADAGLVRMLDLPEALERQRAGTLPSGPWRVHLHVPVFAQLEAPLRSTAPFVQQVLPGLRDLCTHYEVETYTWSVLPESLRELPLAESIAKELEWAQRIWQSR